MKSLQYRKIFTILVIQLYPFTLKEKLIVRLDLNSVENVLLCTRDTNGTYKILDISLEYDVILNDPYATSIDEMYIGTMSIPYIKVTSIHYESLKKRHCLDDWRE